MAPQTETTPFVVEDLFFPSPAGLLHGELVYPETSRLTGAAVIAGPHPLLGGNMHNNIVRVLGDGLAQNQFVSLRFNYRGVGRSQGPRIDLKKHLAQFWQTSHVTDEMDFYHDAQAAVDHLRQVTGPQLPLALIGYSFGCALLPSVQSKAQATVLVLIAPTVSKHDYASYLHMTDLPPLLVIAAEDDFASDTERLQAWFDQLPARNKLVRCQLDNHFFRGHETWLLDKVMEFLHEVWSEFP
jgi:alpha/beta superfamily hydrolase